MSAFSPRRAMMALVCLPIAAFAVLPSHAAAQTSPGPDLLLPAQADIGTILFSRPVNGVYDGTTMTVGAGLFTIADNGQHLQRLTPFKAGTYDMPGGVSYRTNTYQAALATGFYLGKNFSPDGLSIQYFSGQSSDPASGGPYAGKYYTMNLQTGMARPLFVGDNDNAALGVGYLAWGPAGSNQIAYTNSSSEIPVSRPCVYLVNPDGSHQRLLWCAPAEQQTPQGPRPNLAVGALRWAGNGKTLLAYVSWAPLGLAAVKKAAVSPPAGGTNYASIYQINVQSGQAVEVASNVYDPQSGDVSYDGTKILYQQWDYAQCGDTNPEADGVSLCVKDMTTGKVTDLLPPTVWNDRGSYFDSWWSNYWYTELLISPDGSTVAATMLTDDGKEGALYTIHADGTHLEQITPESKTTQGTVQIAWIPVAWSPGGAQLLVNKTMTPVGGANQTRPTEVHIIALSSHRDWRVTDGYAVDWLKPLRPSVIKR